MNAKHSGMAKLWLLNFLGNALLLSALYYWLTLPDAHGWQVAGSAVWAVATIFLGLWLRAGSFAYFRLSEYRDHAAVWPAFHRAIHHLIALAIWAAPLVALEWYLFSLRRYAPQFGVWLWQKAPAFRLRSPRTIFHTADWLLLLLMWILAVAWLPVASTVCALGFKARRMARSLRVLKRGGYWGWLVLLAAAGIYLPYKLMWWIPDLSTLRRQAWSAGARFFCAYLVLISAWVALLLVVGSRSEVEDPERPASTEPKV